jgi:hypothetical protein
MSNPFAYPMAASKSSMDPFMSNRQVQPTMSLFMQPANVQSNPAMSQFVQPNVALSPPIMSPFIQQPNVQGPMQPVMSPFIQQPNVQTHMKPVMSPFIQQSNVQAHMQPVMTPFMQQPNVQAQMQPVMTPFMQQPNVQAQMQPVMTPFMQQSNVQAQPAIQQPNTQTRPFMSPFMSPFMNSSNVQPQPIIQPPNVQPQPVMQQQAQPSVIPTQIPPHIRVYELHDPRSQLQPCVGCIQCVNGFSSAGCLLVDRIRGDIILGRNAFNKKFNDFGGIIDRGETIADAAIRELREETADTILVSHQNDLTGPAVKIPYLNHFHISFIQRVENMQCRNFYGNYNFLKSRASTPSYYLENDQMVRFPINALKLDWEKQNRTRLSKFQTTNKGQSVELEGRVRTVLLCAFNNGLI